MSPRRRAVETRLVYRLGSEALMTTIVASQLIPHVSSTELHAAESPAIPRSAASERKGPEAELLARQAARESNARTYPRGLPVAVGHARGCEVWSVEGKRYLDFFAGAGVLALGHSHPKVVEAVRKQLDVFVHGLDLPTPARDAFVTAVLDLLPSALRGKMRVHICAPTGSDGVEAAIKLCKRATGRHGVLAFQGSYHGMTAGALSVTSLVEVKEKVGALVSEVHFAPFSYCGRCPLKLRPESCGTACAAFTETLLTDTHSGVVRPAAAIVEFVQGEGGTIPATPEFARRLRRATAEAGVPLIADEVQAGLGRTGRWFAFEHFDVTPDVIVLSKALGGIGMPIAAILYRSELDVWEPGTHIGTFRGHQLSMVAGRVALEVMREEGVHDNARERGAELVAGLREIRSPMIAEVRGMGLMVGIDLADPETGAPATAFAKTVRRAAFERGLLCELGGRGDATVRLLPPLVITRQHVQEAIGMLRGAFADAART
jgi:diaminobutyrate-2-oxoglutarate transaminase